MTNKMTSIVLSAALAAFAGPALADDSPSAQPVKTPKQKMHDCMTKQQAANSGMSKDDMKKACQQQLQSLDNHPSVPQPPTHPSQN